MTAPLARGAAGLLVALACAGSHGKADVAQQDLQFRLEAQPVHAAGKPVPIRFVLENRSDAPIHVLTWYTPLEGVNGKIFRVTRDGQSVEFRGRMVKRGDPTADDYARLEPHASLQAVVDLAAAYDLSAPGAYRVEFAGRIHDLTRDPGAIPRAADAQRGLDVPGNAVELRISPR